MPEKIELTGVLIDNVTMEGALNKALSFLKSEKVNTIYTPNAEIMMAAQRDSHLRQILCEADMLVADGAGVVLASKILGKRLPEKVSGIDLTRKLFALERKTKIKYFLFGSQPGVAEEAANRIQSQFPMAQIVGTNNGYLKPGEESTLIEKINTSGAEVLLVALGAPRQEKWIYKYKRDLKVHICIGIGGSLDVFAGKVKLAPEFFRNNGLEWLYRLFREPYRFKRMLDLPRYMLLVLAIRLKIRRNNF